MTPTIIISLIQLAAQMIQSGVQFYQQSQTTLSATDLAAIQKALKDAQTAGDQLRPQVDAALDAASKV